MEDTNKEDRPSFLKRFFWWFEDFYWEQWHWLRECREAKVRNKNGT
jgi:hypothetical protein